MSRTPGVYFLRLNGGVQVGASADLRAYYHKLKRRYGTAFQFLFYIPTDDKNAALAIAAQYQERLAPWATAGGYQIANQLLRQLVASSGHEVQFWFRGT